jgi:hypothetical protein
VRALLSAYRDRNGGQDPKEIYVSADVFNVLKTEKDPLLALEKSASGYTFDGVAIEPNRPKSYPLS